jgi:hypothetical protein
MCPCELKALGGLEPGGCAPPRSPLRLRPNIARYYGSTAVAISWLKSEKNVASMISITVRLIHG